MMIVVLIYVYKPMARNNTKAWCWYPTENPPRPKARTQTRACIVRVQYLYTNFVSPLHPLREKDQYVHACVIVKFY